MTSETPKPNDFTEKFRKRYVGKNRRQIAHEIARAATREAVLRLDFDRFMLARALIAEAMDLTHMATTHQHDATIDFLSDALMHAHKRRDGAPGFFNPTSSAPMIPTKGVDDGGRNRNRDRRHPSDSKDPA